MIAAAISLKCTTPVNKRDFSESIKCHAVRDIQSLQLLRYYYKLLYIVLEFWR